MAGKMRASGGIRTVSPLAKEIKLGFNSSMGDVELDREEVFKAGILRLIPIVASHQQMPIEEAFTYVPNLPGVRDLQEGRAGSWTTPCGRYKFWIQEVHTKN